MVINIRSDEKGNGVITNVETGQIVRDIVVDWITREEIEQNPSIKPYISDDVIRLKYLPIGMSATITIPSRPRINKTWGMRGHR